MSQIGIFKRTAVGYRGHVRTLILDVELRLVPAEPSDAEGAPNWRVKLSDGPEVGAAWNRTGERAGDYLALQLDDPSFPRPVRANLFRSPDDPDVHHLVWSRPPPREPKG